MYNIDLYTYWKKSFSRGKNFSIHPLDEPGKEKYYSNQSHCYHYLKRTDPFVFKSILGVDYNTLIKQQKEDIQTLKNIKSAKNINSLSKSQQNNLERSIHKTNYIPTEEDKKNDLTDKNNREFKENKRYNTIGNEDLNYLSRKFHSFRTQKNFRPYHKERTFKENYGYENNSTYGTKYDQYSTLLNTLKNRSLNKENMGYKRKYDGYTSYEIPFINLHKINKITKLEKSLESLKKGGGLYHMNEEELKQNLINQTSKDFLKEHHLPDVLKIAGTRQLIRNEKIGLSKEMGEKYNPYSFFAPSKNRTKRNYVGDLFKH